MIVALSRVDEVFMFVGGELSKMTLLLLFLAQLRVETRLYYSLNNQIDHTPGLTGNSLAHPDLQLREVYSRSNWMITRR
jgi:hypothetical protein